MMFIVLYFLARPLECKTGDVAFSFQAAGAVSVKVRGAWKADAKHVADFCDGGVHGLGKFDNFIPCVCRKEIAKVLRPFWR